MFPKETTLRPQAKTCQVFLALATCFCFSWCTQGIVTAWAKRHSLAQDEGKLDEKEAEQVSVAIGFQLIHGSFPWMGGKERPIWGQKRGGGTYSMGLPHC